MKLVTIQEMRAIEQQANAGGLSYEQMMDKAGQGVAKEILARYAEHSKTIIGLVGSGNNGGDTLVALGTLAKQGWITFAYQVKPRPEDDALVKWFLQNGGTTLAMNQDKNFRKLEEWIKASSILLDGVLGTGIELPLKADVAAILKFVSAMKELPTVVAVDCPSGVDCNTGEAAAECIPADLTLCMAAIKTGLLISPASQLAGELAVIDIGLPRKLESWVQIEREVISADEVRKVLPERPLDANKSTFGTAMIAAGSINFMGAVYLAGLAAYRIGAGLVKLAVPEILATTLAGHLPEATWLILPDEMGVISDTASEVLLGNLQKVNALLLGPGWGLEETTGHFLEAILKNKRDPSKAKRVGFLDAEESKPASSKGGLPPLIIDADGLKHLSHIKDWPKILPTDTILTPHPGEMAFISGKTVAEIQANRLEIAQQYAKLWDVILVLKGAVTVVAEPGGMVKVVPIASPALAKAGTGDALAGIIAGLRTQGISAFASAWAGAWIHARAGVLAAKQVGTTASVLSNDLIQSVPKVFSELSY